ncbi:MULTISPECIES: hypothetical protein [Sphingobacterium]|uniref:hypothetical protein n=1 Tax=Sphingobacterium TaxID=28453 RepID=UPI001966C13B|nr:MULTISPECIES: hypothetical protein [Sphingobacterium]QRY59621.1 hypothetical protein JVX97_09370 [Sphingobacterium siyangense]
MKKIAVHLASMTISLIWLVIYQQTWNPFSLKGPQFLKFYLILLMGFYTSVLILKFLQKPISKTVRYFMLMILLVGIIKLLKGLYLGKPIGYLTILLIIEVVVISLHIDNKRSER